LARNPKGKGRQKFKLKLQVKGKSCQGVAREARVGIVRVEEKIIANKNISLL